MLTLLAVSVYFKSPNMPPGSKKVPEYNVSKDKDLNVIHCDLAYYYCSVNLCLQTSLLTVDGFVVVHLINCIIQKT